MTTPADRGLWRTVLAGPGGSLAEAFDNLERSARVQRLQRHAERGVISARVMLAPEEGQGYWELLRIRDDIYVIITNFAYRDPRFELVPGDGLVQFNFRVSGDLTYGVARPLRFNRPALHIWRQPTGIEMREWTAPSSHEQMVCISVHPEFLRRHFLSADVPIPPRLQAFVAAQASQIDWCQMPLTAEMMEIIGKMLNHSYEGLLSLIYLESLTFELLCAAVNHFSTLPWQPTEQYSEAQLRALKNARDLVMKQPAPLPTGKRIARTVGLAEKTLYNGFRAVYGETLNEFTRRCRMQQAMTLLRDQHWSVDRVSEAVGYAHPTSFAAAFRRYFGVRPIDFKRKTPRK
jgi:AraC-like DNA-binding protein